MRSTRTEKLFHAVVGLGLAVVGCGGQTGDASDSGRAPVDSSGPKDATAGAVSSDAATGSMIDAADMATLDATDAATLDALEARVDARIEAAVDATWDLDATDAAALAQDVAQETWHVIVIR